MQKNICQLEVKIGEKVYHLLCDHDSPLAHVKEALFQFLKYIGQVEDQAIKIEEEKKATEDIVEQPPQENCQSTNCCES